MKLLHFALVTSESPQLGLRAALQSISDQYVEFDWLKYFETGRIADLRREFLELAQSWQPNVVFMQVQTPDILSDQVLTKIACTTISWCGDVRDETPEWAWNLAPHVSLNCFSNLRDVYCLRSFGYPAEFLNIGFSPDVFTPIGLTSTEGSEIVFLGNNYGDLYPQSKERRRMVALLHHRYGGRFAVYGRGWDAEGIKADFLQESDEATVYRSCKIAINQNHYNSVPRFSSDRILRAMGSGAFVATNHWPQLDDDFKVGEHLVRWHNFDELCRALDYFLDNNDQRERVAKAGCDHVRKNHSWHARMGDLASFIKTYESQGRQRHTVG